MQPVKSSVVGQQPPDAGVIAHSAAMCTILALVPKIGGADVPVLILGELGVGRQTIARQIHRQSPRAAGPFVHVVCGALREPDLGVTYESTGVTDPAAVRTEATAVMSALMKAQPGLRGSFHGLWAYAMKDGKRSPVMELPMGQIP